MRMVVMFDLPVETREQRKIATKFRKYLLDEGYVMMQFSVYYRICNGKDMVNKYLLRLEDKVPEKGSVRLITLTEKQFSEMKVLVGGVSPIEEKLDSSNLSVF
ncbi:CRISPR-associated endonuclease Cas2 [Trichococcus patagoniensis]|nr:CRISPR-associated endonuclease Cas2 [Trichococcus patagoniensis]